MPAVRVVVRDMETGVFHRGVRIDDGRPFAYQDCDSDHVREVEGLPPDVDWRLVHDCLRDQTLMTRGPKP